MTKGEISNLVATIVTNGFHIEQTERFTNNNIILNVKRFDKLGAEIRYSILFTESKSETGVVASLLTLANAYASKPLVISDYFISDKCTTYTFHQFYDFFGGIVNTGIILIPNLPDILDELGRNELPTSLQGEPFDLHELYVKECLQFMLQSPARRYGKDRLFESLPDGIIVCKNRTMILYDSKAYTNGFNISSDDINRFASYVQDFNKRYSSLLGSVFTFTVISGKLNSSSKSIETRSKQLYKKCNCNLSCITSRELGNIVQVLQKEHQFRTSILWENVFSELVIDITTVQKEIDRIKKDNLN
jgi:hypothetical protein